MSRAGSARRGGEVVDIGSWHTPAPAASAYSSYSAASHWLDVEPATLVVDRGSDRPLYCLSVHPSKNSFVVGGADHSLRVYDLTNGSLRRELYSKTSGHTEWVTSCAYLPDGRILSGGMDGQVVLWGSTGSRGIHLTGHTASISQVRCDAREVGLSASYDRTLKVWSLHPRAPKELHTLRGCNSAVTAVEWVNSLVVAGTREGQVSLFDINTAQLVRQLQPSASGQIITLKMGSVEGEGREASNGTHVTSSDQGQEPAPDLNWIVAAGGADGCLRLYDLRSEGCIFEKRLSTGNPGSVTDAAFGSNRLAVGLSDGVVSVLLDARRGWATSAHLKGHRAPVQAVSIPSNNPNVVCSAASNGWFMVHDLSHALSEPQVEAAYALGLTTSGGINAMWVGDTTVVAAGDDGNPCILQY